MGFLDTPEPVALLEDTPKPPTSIWTSSMRS
jgi:hypothetical protein